MYVFDYGAPIGYRLAMWHPERITAIISQNGNMYEEGLGKKWEARKAYWQNPTDELRQQFASAYALETIIGQYTFGTPEGSVGPDGYSLDYYYVCQPGRAEMQNDLILDYRSNVALYPEFQKYSVPINHLCWPYGERTIRRSFQLEPMPSGATCQMLRYILYPAVTLLSKAITPR
jgi:hypothetical protein